MRPVQVVLTDQEIGLVDNMIKAGHSKSRADLLRKAVLEYCIRHDSGNEIRY